MLKETAQGIPYLTLREGTDQGVFRSAVYETEAWNDLVASWNADTPKGSSVEVQVRARIPAYGGEWTDPISWGEWSPWIKRSCPDQTDSHPRKNGEKGGWAHAYSFHGAGDSSMNIRDGFTADAFQILCVVRREAKAPVFGRDVKAEGIQVVSPLSQESPRLYLLAVTFKNTESPLWKDPCHWEEEASFSSPEAKRAHEQTKEASSVLLSVPAISQMKRDPAYADCICSATCVTMLLDSKGEDLLPEEVVMGNYDYGFGGNGNWSFSAAIAGAFGYRSFVHYGSFQSLRRELDQGNGCTLSVRYSKEKDGKYPFLENAPCNTGGHLINIVGYRLDPASGEYIYYANDPAAEGDDQVLHRVYQESQLSAAWSRRAMYLVHEKVEGAGGFAHTRREGKLEEVRSTWKDGERAEEGVVDAEKDALSQGTFRLRLNDGEELVLPQDFREKPRANYGMHGSIFYTVENRSYDLPAGVKRVTANDKAHYEHIEITESGGLRLPKEADTVYVITNSGDSYRFYK